jgi:hypothetical protein
LRGQAYAMLGRWTAAEKEFLQIVNNRGLALNSALAVLAPLQLANAYKMDGKADQAKLLYRRFLLDWKDADSDVPYRRARVASSARLQR